MGLVKTAVQYPCSSASSYSYKNRQGSKTRIALVAATAAISLLPLQSRAASVSWNGNGSPDNSWMTAANWVGGSAPLANDLLFFDGTNQVSTFNSFPAATQFNGITFNSTAGAFLLDGNAITLGGNILNNVGTLNAQSINFGMTLNATRSAFVVAGGTLGISGVMSGVGGFTKDGPGTVILSNANTFGGAFTSLGNGTTQLNFAAAGAPAADILPATTPLVFGTSGGSLIVNGSAAGNSQTFASMTVANDAYAGIGAISNGGPVTLDVGNITRGTRSLIHFGVPSSGSLIATGLPAPVNGILGGWATANGTGYATTSGNQVVPFTGYTDVASGAIPDGAGTSNTRLTGTGAFSSSNIALNTLLVANGAAAASTITNTGMMRFADGGGMFIAQPIFTNTGTVTINGGSITAGTGAAPASVYVLSNGSFGNIALQTSSVFADNGPNGTLTVIKGGNSVWRTTNANTFTGGVYVNQGRLETTNIGGFGTGSINIQNGAGLWFNTAGNATNPININTIGLAEGNIYRGSIRTVSGTILSGPINLITDGRIFLRAAGGTGTVTSVISGNGGLEFGVPNDGANVGTTILAGVANANVYSGDTTITGGSLRLGAADQIPNGAGKGNVVMNGAPSQATFDLNGFNETINGLTSITSANAMVVRSASAATLSIGDNNVTSTFGGNFNDAININKIGGGMLVISGGGHNFTGTTTVTAGTLQLAATGNLNSSRLINVRNGGTFDVSLVSGYSVPGNQTLGGTGALRGNVTLSDPNAALAPGLLNTAGSLALANDLTLGGGNLRIDLAATSAGTSDLVSVAGNLTFAGTTTLSINRLAGSVAAGTYTVMTYNTTSGTPNFNFPIVRQSLTAFINSGSVRLSIGSGAPSNLTWVGDGSGNNWDIQGTANWSGGAAGDNRFYDWDSVTFDDTGSNSPDVQITTTVQPTTFTLANSAKNYNFGGSGAIINADLVKTGTGAATLSNGGTNQFLTATISAGTMVFQNNNLLPSLTVNGGTVEIRSGNTSVTGGAINNTGRLVSFNGANPLLSNLTVNSGGQINVLGNPTFTFTTVAAGGTMIIGNGVDGGQGDPQGSVINNGNLVYNRPNGDNYNTAFVFGGNGTVTKQGNGDATFSGASSSTGNFVVSAGKIFAANSNSFGAVDPGVGSVQVNIGAAVDIGAGAAANAINFGRRQFFVAGGGTDGSGVLKNDNGTNGQQNAFQLITLTGDATFGGSGRWDMRAAQVGGVNQATLTLNGNTLTKVGAGSFILVNTTVTDGNINFNDGIIQLESATSIPASATGKAITIAGGRTLQFFTLTGDVSRQIVTTGDITMGTNTNNNPGSTLGSPIQLGGNLTINPVNANGTGTLTLTGNITETGGSRSLTKNNNGTGASLLVINGNSSYTGNTNINGGILQVNGTHTGGATYNISSGATLAGTGSISAFVNANGGAILAPGASVGTLTVGSLSLQGNTLSYELGGGSADRINVTSSGGFSVTGTNTFNLAALAGASAGTFPLIDYSGTPLADLSNFGLGTTSIGSLTFSLVNNTANTSIDLSVLSTITNATWTGATNSNWSVGTNWTGGVPNSIDATANFVSSPAPSTFNVTVDSPQTVGAINFNSATSFTIGGASAITMDVSSGNASINVTAGSHTISAPVTLNDNLTVTSAAATGVALTGNLTATGKTITKAGTGSVQFNNVRAAALNVSAGSAKISQKGTANSAAGTSVVQSLAITAGASLDLTNNSMVIDYSSLGTTITDLRNHLKTGRLFTSTATPANTRIGYTDNASLGTPKTTFAGQSVDTTSVLIKFTYSGDADLDGDADGVDIGTWATNFTGELGGGPTATRVWSQGDWDYDGDVDGVDAGLWATAFTGELGGNGLGSIVVNDPTISPQAAAILQGMGITVVPEPATLGLLGLCVAGGLARRSRRETAAAKR